MTTMDDCQRTAGRLASFIDDLLPAAEQADVEQHLGACPPCRAAALRERGGRTVLREHARGLADVSLPPGLRSRCEALVRDHAAAETSRGFVTRRFASLTAAMTVVIGFFLFSLATQRSDTLLAAQLTADHAKCLHLFANNESPDADARKVEQMLQEDYGWDLRVPPSSSANGIRLKGARRCLYAGGPVPHIMYVAGGHDMSLYVLDGVTRRPAELVSFGHRSQLWATGRRTYVVVWPDAAGDMAAAVRYLEVEAR